METIEATTTNKIMLVNPNPDRVYRDSYCGKEYEFKPLKRVMVEESLAMVLLEQARINESSAAAQASAEMNEYRALLMKGGHFPSAFGPRYVDISQDGKVTPKTKTYSFTPLVRLDEPMGRQVYEQGIELAKKMGIEMPTGDGSPTSMEVSSPAGKISIEKPSNSWSLSQLAEYCNKYGGLAGTTEPHGRLYHKARRLYMSRVELLKSVGVQVQDPDIPEAEGEEK